MANTSAVEHLDLLACLEPEYRLLFSSGRPGRCLEIPVLGDAQWAALRYAAEREKAAIALWRFLAPAVAGAAPPAVANLRSLALVMEFRMHHLQQRLTASVAALRNAGIRCLLLKGAAVATKYHRSFADRPMLDIDLLVPTGMAQRAHEVLLAADWIVPAPEDTAVLPPGGVHHLPALHDRSGVEVSLEIHTDLFPPGHPFPLTSDALWQEAQPLGCALEGAWLPSPRHLALHACVHLAWSHMFRTGTWRTSADLRAITNDPAFRWDELVALARNTRASTACYWTLRLARGLCDLAVPPNVFLALAAEFATPAPRWMARRATSLLERHLLAVLIPGGADCPSVSLRRVAWSCALRPRRSGHGSARPWRQTTGDPDPAVSAVTARVATVATMGSPLAFRMRTRRFFTYLRSVLRPPTSFST